MKRLVLLCGIIVLGVAGCSATDQGLSADDAYLFGEAQGDINKVMYSMSPKSLNKLGTYSKMKASLDRSQVLIDSWEGQIDQADDEDLKAFLQEQNSLVDILLARFLAVGDTDSGRTEEEKLGEAQRDYREFRQDYEDEPFKISDDVQAEVGKRRVQEAGREALQRTLDDYMKKQPVK